MTDLTLVGHGHPSVRATHHKTLEFSPDPSITDRATCVLAVSTAVGSGRPLAGPVSFKITIGGYAATGTAVANPDWRPGDTAIIRRSSQRLPGTLATDADLAAADLPRDLATRLTDPDLPVSITLQRTPRYADGRAALVLMRADAPSERLATELAAADLVLPEDATARALTDIRQPPPADLVSRVAGGEVDRILVLGSEVPGVTVAGLLGRPDLVLVEVIGLPPALTAAAASPRRAPYHLVGRVADAAQRRALRRAPADAQLVFAADGSQLPDLLASLRAPTTGVVLTRPGIDPWARWSPLSDLDPLPRGHEVVCCVDGIDGETDLEPGVEELLGKLCADGVPTKVLASALATALGWPKNRAYDTITRLRRPS